MRTLFLIAILTAAPVSAQTIISTHPPLSPAEAAAVLRGSHSIADYTDYRSPGTGPTIVVMGPSTTPWDWSPASFAPTRPLANDGGYYAPDYAPFYGSHYGTTYGRHTYGAYARTARSRGRIDRPVVAPRPRVEPVHLTMPSARAGARRR